MLADGLCWAAQGLRVGVVDVSQQGVSISSAQAEALEHGVEYLTKVHPSWSPCAVHAMAAGRQKYKF